MKIAMSKTREQFPLSTKKVLKRTVKVVLHIAFPFLIVGIIIGYILSLSIIPLMCIMLIIILSVFIYRTEQLAYETYFYDMAVDYLVIRKGTATSEEITIPYEHIQDVYIDQDFFDRIFGLYNVRFSSVNASSGALAFIDGVEKLAAVGLKDALLHKIKDKILKNKITLR